MSSTTDRKTDSKMLRAFLEDNGGKPDLVHTAMELLQPFFDIAQAGAYPLVPAEELNLEMVVVAIAKATNQQVRKVIPVSVSQAIPNPKGTEDGYRKSLEKRLGDLLLLSFGLNSLLLGYSLWDSLVRNFCDSLMHSLGYSFENSLWDSLLVGSDWSS
ncbi:MAG: hypothetical protein AAB444_03000 [Patescibacteria group bacterium]